MTAFTREEISQLKAHMQGDAFAKRLEAASAGCGIASSEEKNGGYRLALNSYGERPVSEAFLDTFSQEADRYCQEQFGKVFDKETHLRYRHAGRAEALAMGV